MKPQFTPAGGIGSTYKDPKTGEVYKYTAGGWVKQSQDIKKETAESQTFEIKPDEKDLVEKLKAGGSSQEQINQGLAERRKVLSGLGTEAQDEEVGEVEKDISNPFGGMTKQEMLRDAFNKGVTSTTELKKLETLYDILVGGEEDVGESAIADVKKGMSAKDFANKYGGQIDDYKLINIYNENSIYDKMEESPQTFREWSAGKGELDETATEAYAISIRDGDINISNVPSEYRTAVTKRLQELEPEEGEEQKSKWWQRVVDVFK